MPPIMGAAAFLLAENLQASYVDVMLAALIPSILYYFSLFVFADLEAGRLNIARVAEDKIPPMGVVMRKGWFVFVPFVVLLVGLFNLICAPKPQHLSLFWCCLDCPS